MCTRKLYLHCESCDTVTIRSEYLQQIFFDRARSCFELQNVPQQASKGLLENITFNDYYDIT